MRILVCTGLIVVFLCSALYATASDPASALQKGVRLFEEKQFVEALAVFNEVVSQDPKSGEALFRLAVMYENGYGVERNTAEAARFYRKAWQAGNAEAYERLNGLYASALDPDKESSTKETAAQPSEPAPPETRVFLTIPKETLARFGVEVEANSGEDQYELVVTCDNGCTDLNAQATKLEQELGVIKVYSDSAPVGGDRLRSILSGQKSQEIKITRKALSRSVDDGDGGSDQLTINVVCGGWCKVVKKVAEAVVAVFEAVTRSVEADAQAVAKPPSVQVATGKYYGLIIGINEYQHVTKLKNAVNDARVVAQTLQENYGFENRVLLDGEANRDNIMKSLNDLRKQLTENDSLLIFYSGHGLYNKDNEASYWLPVDADKDDNTRWLETRTISDQLKLISARHALVIADSCFSGTMTRSANAGLTGNSTRENYLNKLLEKPSRVLIASGGNEPVTDAGGNGHSIFSDVLIAALKSPFEPVFTAEELMTRHLKESVAGRTEQTPEYKVVRNSGHDGGDFVFVKKQ